MKTIGMIGGSGWESTVEYYKTINRKISEASNYEHSARIVMFSVDFFEISSRVAKQDFDGMEKFLTDIAIQIEDDGADCLMICANTLHMFAEQISQNISIPIIHIADATAAKIKEKNMRKVGLLGTKFTMEMPFYKDRLKNMHGIDVVVPPVSEREYIQKTFLDEFFKGKFTNEARVQFLGIINRLVDQGAEGIILGCTEIPLLISQKDTIVPLFDTLENHALAAVDFVLSAGE
ncbi:MAG: aspartate/glutamate racemase family protein [Bacteroidetes bacterium]|nr:aspartate/glutamate racemase family protein [Bacteroidota bacterium]MBU1718402.1 aspartate/glutamate racemase family protein [Bacteroidota bacterium]